MINTANILSILKIWTIVLKFREKFRPIYPIYPKKQPKSLENVLKSPKVLFKILSGNPVMTLMMIQKIILRIMAVISKVIGKTMKVGTRSKFCNMCCKCISL